MKPSFIAKTKGCGIDFWNIHPMKLTVYKIQICLNFCVVYEPQLCYAYAKRRICCISWRRSRHARAAQVVKLARLLRDILLSKMKYLA
jgi:hypothetical protein